MTKKEQVIQDIRDRKLAIENDNLEAAEKCRQVIWPNDKPVTQYKTIEIGYFIYQSDIDKGWVFCGHLDYIRNANTTPATELLKILEGEESVNNANEIKNKIQQLEQELDFLKVEEKKLEGEWMPEVGKEYEFSNNENEWYKAMLLGVINHEYKYVIDDKSSVIPGCAKLCRPIQKKQITASELFEKAGLNEKEWEVVK